MPKITATEGLVIASVVAGVGYVVYKSREKETSVPREELSEPMRPEGAGFVAWPMDGEFRRGNEIFNAKIVVVTKPMEHAGHVGLPTSNNWLTNVAFWMTYPEALEFPGGKLPSNFKSVPDWKKFADAWVRIFKLVKKYRAEPPPKPPKPTDDDDKDWSWGGGRFDGVLVYLRTLDSGASWQAGYRSKKHCKIIPLYNEPFPQYRDEAMTLADKAIMANEAYIEKDELRGWCHTYRTVVLRVERIPEGWHSSWKTGDVWKPLPVDVQPTVQKAVALAKAWVDSFS